MMFAPLEFPQGAEFAFTILDDTDDTTVTNGRPVYDLLRELDIRTTKTVWAFDAPPENRGPYFAGQTLSSPEYLEWVRSLSRDGFEIAFHNATMGSSIRAHTLHALDVLESEFNQPVHLHCNHGQNRENLYWGIDRYSSLVLRGALRLWTAFTSYPAFEGHLPSSPYYWADIATDRISYMRAFAYRRLNGDHIPPGTLFADPLKRPAPLFFNSAEAPDIHAFNKLVNTASIDRLRKQRGWAIVSTHFGKGFFSNKKLNLDFAMTMRHLAEQPGWYVPVSQVLDYLKVVRGVCTLSSSQRLHMEVAHIWDRLTTRMLRKVHARHPPLRS